MPDDPNEGSDEDGCRDRCDDGKLFCDDKCISRHDICNGRVDCSSGVDEQDCIDNLTGVIQSVLCIFVMTSAVYILVRFFRVVNELEGSKDQSYESTRDEERLGDRTNTYADDKIQNVIAQKTYEQPLPTPNLFQPPLPTHHHDLQEDPILDCRESFYQEPSILATRSVFYERVITGGNSGASSVYAFEPTLDTSKSFTYPPAPPPTPTPSRSPVFGRSNFYENMEE